MNTILLFLILAVLVYIILKIRKMEELLSRLDLATNEIAKDLKELKDKLKDVLTPELKTRLEANITRLEGIGADEDNPIPE